jgi:hypothetical protein
MAKLARRWLGLFGVLAALSCSFIVETEEISSGCGIGKKFCFGDCVDADDPAYGCLENVCDPCLRDNGVPRCGEDGCEYETCLYGWGCFDCSVHILSNRDHCGHCYNPCTDPDSTCSEGRCVPPPDTGAGGEAGE